MDEGKKTKFRFNTLAIILIIIFAFAITPITLQNDTFYTIAIGDYILENGITMQDPFSWHEGLTYTFPHWAYDVCIYLIYNIGGFTGIYVSTIVLAAILGILMYLTTSKLMSNRPISFVITIASMYLLRDFITARAQLLTFILFLLTIYFIEQFLKTKKLKYAIGLIIIPILIANFHAATFYFYFVLYLPYIGEYMIYILSNANLTVNKAKIKSTNKKLQKKQTEKLATKLKSLEEKNSKIIERKQKEKEKSPYKIIINVSPYINHLIIIMIICLFTGFLTPQSSFEPYTHLIKIMSGTSTNNISEHLPLTLVYNINYAGVLILFLAILTFTDTKIRLCDLFMFGGLTVLTFYTRRQESLFMIMCSFIFIRLVCSMLNKYDPGGNEKLEKGMTKILGMIITIAIVAYISFLMHNRQKDAKYVDEISYPVSASNWILENLDVENIKLYNDYNFGSYLLFRGIPVFIDSRCDLYTPEFNVGVNIFNDFLFISSGATRNIEEMLDKYGITHVITYKDSPLTLYMEQTPLIYTKLYPVSINPSNNFCIYERIRL